MKTERVYVSVQFLVIRPWEAALTVIWVENKREVFSEYVMTVKKELGHEH